MGVNVEDQAPGLGRDVSVIVRPGRGATGGGESLRFVGEAIVAVWDDPRVKDFLQSRSRERQ